MKIFDGDLLCELPCTVLQDEQELQQLPYCSGLLEGEGEASTLLTMLAAVKPRTIAIMLIRISRATERVEGDISIECLMLNVEKAMACLTETSERSIWA